jgi:hypothetical protein
VQRLTIVVAVFSVYALATWGVDEIFAKALAGFFNWIKLILYNSKKKWYVVMRGQENKVKAYIETEKLKWKIMFSSLSPTEK